MPLAVSYGSKRSLRQHTGVRDNEPPYMPQNPYGDIPLISMHEKVSVT